MSTDGNRVNHRKGVNEDINEDLGSHLHQLKSAGAITLSHQSSSRRPKTAATGDFRKRIANPTPLGLMGFVIAALTFAMINMGWGGSTTLVGVAGIFYFTGPVLLLLALIFEWIMGNFFSMLVMGLFAVFWLSFAILETPSFGAAASYSPTGSATEGAASKGYNATIALYLLVWGFWLFTTFIFTLKTNCVFAAIFFCAFTSSFVFSGAYWKVSTGEYEMAGKLQKAGGGIFSVLALLGYYITVVMIAAEIRMTVKLPVGDLSHFWSNPDAEMADMEKGE